jgi:hypothetical protein
VLEHFGAVVTVVGSADDALRPRSMTPDVLLSDLATWSQQRSEPCHE